MLTTLLILHTKILISKDVKKICQNETHRYANFQKPVCLTYFLPRNGQTRVTNRPKCFINTIPPTPK